VILILPYGVWLALPFGSVILAAIPYGLIGGGLGWLIKRYRFSRSVTTSGGLKFFLARIRIDITNWITIYFNSQMGPKQRMG
jgi:hypothetical protein